MTYNLETLFSNALALLRSSQLRNRQGRTRRPVGFRKYFEIQNNRCWVSRLGRSSTRASWGARLARPGKHLPRWSVLSEGNFGGTFGVERRRPSANSAACGATTATSVTREAFATVNASPLHERLDCEGATDEVVGVEDIGDAKFCCKPRIPGLLGFVSRPPTQHDAARGRRCIRGRATHDSRDKPEGSLLYFYFWPNLTFDQTFENQAMLSPEIAKSYSET